MVRRKPQWNRLSSGLYVPPLLRFAGNPWPCSGCCERCDFCTSGTSPLQFSVTYQGLVNSGCSDCEDILGTDTFVHEHTNTWTGPGSTANNGPCVWGYTFASPACSVEWTEVQVDDLDSDPGNVRITISWHFFPEGSRFPGIVFSLVNQAPDCSAGPWVLSLNRGSDATFGGCKIPLATATATVTAL